MLLLRWRARHHSCSIHLRSNKKDGSIKGLDNEEETASDTAAGGSGTDAAATSTDGSSATATASTATTAAAFVCNEHARGANAVEL